MLHDYQEMQSTKTTPLLGKGKERKERNYPFLGWRNRSLEITSA